MTIQKLVDGVIGREGGYSNHPADRGGPTRWGVTEQVARAYGYRGDMRQLPRETAASIYIARYWTEPNFHLVAERYEKVAEELFDTGINMGTVIAGKFLQRALNALNRGASDYPDIGTDGRLGTISLAALDSYKRKRGAQGEAVLLRALDALQGARYVDLAEQNQSQEAFLYGWLANRVGALS